MRWVSPCLNLARNKLVSEVEENQRPLKTIGLNNKRFEFIAASHSRYCTGLALPLIHLLSAHLILCKWGHVRPWIENDCPRVGGLEGTLPHHVVGQIDPEYAVICPDVRAVELEWFVGEAI